MASALPPASTRPEVHDQPAAIVGEAVRRRRRARSPRGRDSTAARAASRSGAPGGRGTRPTAPSPRRTAMPAGRADSATPVASASAGRHVRFVARLVGRDAAAADRRRAAARPGLQAVVAEVLDAAHADPRRDVGHRPAGQDRDGGRGPAAPRTARSQSPQGPPGERLDRRGGRVAAIPARACRRSPTTTSSRPVGRQRAIAAGPPRPHRLRRAVEATVKA